MQKLLFLSGQKIKKVAGEYHVLLRRLVKDRFQFNFPREPVFTKSRASKPDQAPSIESINFAVWSKIKIYWPVWQVNRATIPMLVIPAPTLKDPALRYIQIAPGTVTRWTFNSRSSHQLDGEPHSCLIALNQSR